jgi:hypothetical protein
MLLLPFPMFLLLSFAIFSLNPIPNEASQILRGFRENFKKKIRGVGTQKCNRLWHNQVEEAEKVFAGKFPANLEKDVAKYKQFLEELDIGQKIREQKHLQKKYLKLEDSEKKKLAEMAKENAVERHFPKNSFFFTFSRNLPNC